MRKQLVTDNPILKKPINALSSPRAPVAVVAAVHEYPMVIALFALSLVMIVGGIAAVVQGFPYVRLESGLAMVIAGATASSAGAVVLALAVALTELKRLAGGLRARSDLPYEPATELPLAASPPALRAPAFETTPAVASLPAAVTAGAAGLAGVELGSARELLGESDRGIAFDPPAAHPGEIEPPLPGLVPPAVPGPIPPPAPGEPISAEDDLFVAVDDRLGHRPAAEEAAPASPDPAQEELALRPALEEPAAATAPEAALATEQPEPKSAELQVVGTYSSGDNTYVMFANGTIQADTPRGRFTFQSLDELKEFVDSGGEATTRGAA